MNSNDRRPGAVALSAEDRAERAALSAEVSQRLEKMAHIVARTLGRSSLGAASLGGIKFDGTAQGVQEGNDGD